MSLAVRVIPCLDVDAGRVVKGVNFQQLRDAGDPVELAKVYDAEGADELTFLDISASHEGRSTTMDIVSATAEQVFIPLTVGGGSAASRTSTGCCARAPTRWPSTPRPSAAPSWSPRSRTGSATRCSCSRSTRAGPPGTDSGFEVTTHGGRTSAGLDALEWAARAAELGAGEILLNAMDADGTTEGFDLDLIRLVRREVSIPVIASGGAGAVEHFAPAVDAGADAVLAATVFHFGTLRIAEVKRRWPRPVTRCGEPCRPQPGTQQYPYRWPACPLVAGGPLEAPGVLQGAVGPGGGDVLALRRRPAAVACAPR